MEKLIRLLVALGPMLVLTILSVDAVLLALSLRTIARSNEASAHTQQTIATLDQAIAGIRGAETGQRGYLLTGDPAYLEPYREARERVAAALRGLRRLTIEELDHREQLDALERATASKFDELEQTIALRDSGNVEGAMEVVRSDLGRALMEQIADEAGTIRGAEDLLLSKRLRLSEAAVRRAVITFLVTTATALLLLVGFFALQRRDARLRDRSAARLAESEAWLATTLGSIGDAVIATDQDGQVRFLNAVAEALTGWRQAEAAGRPIVEVLHIVNEQTREPAEHPVERVLREGVVVGLANHTILISRDGLETPIEDSAAPIRGEGGAMSGVVMVFRDVTVEREADRRLEDSMARKAAILETALDAIITMDHDGAILEFNPAAERIFGHHREDAIGRSMAELLIPPSLRDDHRRGLAHLLSTGEGPILGRRIEVPALRADGTEFTAELAVAPISKAGPPMFTAHLRDITDRKRREADLRRMTAIVEHSPDFIGLADAELRAVFVNAAGRRLVGLESETDVSSTSVLDYFPEPERPRIAEEALPDLTRDGRWEGEVAFRHFRNGATIPMLWSAFALPDPESGRPFYACVARDITERKRAAHDLMERERQFRTLADSIPQLAWMARADGWIFWYNRRWYEYTGTTPEQMEGWGWQSVHDPAELPRVIAHYKECLDSGMPWEDTFPLRRRDAAMRWHLSRAQPVRDDRGEIVRWFGTNTDVTQLRELEEDLRVAKEEAEGANQAKDTFLAVLSHELRTPLNPILLAATAMLERPGDSEELRPTLEMIRQNVNLQARLIDDLLDVMRIVRGKMPLHWEVADCHKLIDQAIQICRSEVFGKEQRLTLDRLAEEHHLNADPARMQQVFWNLIKNAVKFTPDGGTITIRTRSERALGDREPRIVIEVSDTGIGIDPEVLPKIFDPFQQGESTTTRRFGGLGLGLAICRGIVEAHGGTLEAESEGEGRGTTFRIALKALPRSAVAGRDEPRDDAEGPCQTHQALKILFVEDEPTTLRLMARLLRSLGHDVTPAMTIGAATAEIEEADFDLVVSDLGLPDGSGLELMRRVVAQKGALPAIALTGYGMEEDIRRSREAGFTAHLTKPIDFAKLEAMILRVTGSTV